VDITIDGYPGQSITGVVPAYPGSDPNPCDEQRFCTLQDRYGWACLVSHTEPGAIDTLWVVEPVESRQYFLVVSGSYTPTTSSRLLAEMNAIVDSMTNWFE
jgi:hypothetical protein